MGFFHRLRERSWFIPALLCLGAFVLAEALIAVDVGESGSRDILGAIATSSLAIAGTTFSITMAVLALTSSSYGPRLAVLFALAAVGVLIHFIHHISDSIQVSTLARRVRSDLLATVDQLYPAQIGDDGTSPADPWGGMPSAPSGTTPPPGVNRTHPSEGHPA